MQYPPKITIVTPSFNQGKFIEQTIESVISQGYPNLEYIIIDGGSTDNTLDVIHKYENEISHWVSEPDNGQTNAINKGIGLATGDIFNWLNSDDCLAEGALEHIAQSFLHNDIDVLCGICGFMDQSGKRTKQKTQTKFYESPEKTISSVAMGQPAQYYKMDCIRQLMPLEESFRYSMDMELWFRYLFKYGTAKVMSTEKELSVFRLHGSSKTIAEGEDFSKDDHTMFYSMLSKAGAPDVILDYYKSLRNPAYRDQWDFSLIDPQLLIAFFADKLATLYYTQRQYSKARECIHIARNYGIPTTKAFFLKYLKLTVLPIPLIEFFRTIKHITAHDT